MAGFPMIAMELSTPGGTQYYSTTGYSTRALDTPSAQQFLPYLLQDVDFDRRVGCVLFGESPRGSSNWGVIRLGNAAGRLDALVVASLRDQPIVLKRGESLDAYTTFTTVANLIVDRLVFASELYIDVYVTDIGTKLERSAQTSLYSSTLTNTALRQKPIPFSVGRVFQIPLTEKSTEGNRHLDVHDSALWLGVDAMMDNGASLLPSLDDVESTAPVTNSYLRSLRSDTNGIERRSAVGGRQVANVQGALNVVSTPINDDCSSLAAWTETNGGIANRDVSLSGGGFRFLNTAGGAQLTLVHATSNAATATDVWWYSFQVTSYTSGYLRMSPGNSVERQIKETGTYTGVFQRTANFQMQFDAPNGSNCDMIIDNIILRKVTLIEQLSDVIKYIATSDGVTNAKGPLLTADLDMTAISALQTATGYELGFYLDAQYQIADIMDLVMNSFGGWWYVNRLGKLTVGRLLAATGVPVLALDSNSILDGMSIELDTAKGLSNRILAQKNWTVYQDAEVAPSLNYVALDPVAHGTNVTITISNTKFTATGAGAARSVPLLFGDRVYFEMTANAMDGGSTFAMGQQGLRATMINATGINVGSVGYRANGNKYRDNAISGFGATWTANDVIGCAVDFRPAARGQSGNVSSGRIWFSKNGVWQASGNPATDANPAFLTLTAAHLGFLSGGGSATGPAGTFNFGHAAFAATPPEEFDSPASQKTRLTSAYRFQYQSATSLAATYAQALAREALAHAADNQAQYLDGIATLLASRADARTECDRWCGLYSAEAFFYTFDVLLAPSAADQLEPGDLISVTYPRFGLAAKLMRVVGIKGSLLGRRVTIRARG